MSLLEVTLDAPDSAGEGEFIPFTVILTNRSDSPLHMHLQGRDIIFDVSIEDNEGKVVWHRLAGSFTQAILRLDTFAPGEVRRLHSQWDQRASNGKPVNRGSYFARASVPTESGVLESQPRVLKLT